MDEQRPVVPAHGGAESPDGAGSNSITAEVFEAAESFAESLRRDRERFAPLFDEKYPHFNQRQRDFAIRVCRERRLNPYADQIFFDLRPGPRGAEEVKVIVGITSLRLLAIRSNCHDGNELPHYEYDENKKLYRSISKIHRIINNRRVTFIGAAFWSEYFPGFPGTLFDQKPHVCLSICSEAIATRFAFPDETGAIYVPEEMLCRDRAPRRAPVLALPGDGEPGSPGALEAAFLHEFGITDSKIRNDIVRSFREAGAGDDDSPAFYAAIYRAVRSNPVAYHGTETTAPN